MDRINLNLFKEFIIKFKSHNIKFKILGDFYSEKYYRIRIIIGL
jgi:hypothetical protein